MGKLKQVIKYPKFFSGYKKFYTSILMSFIFSLMLPVIILGIILYTSLYQNAKQNFYKTHKKLVTEITSYVWQTTNNIETDLSTLKTDTAFRNYRKLVGNDVITSVSEYQHVTNNLLSIASKYPSLYSIYFFDKDFGTIYNTDYGSDTWDNFQDTEWLDQITSISRVQRLKPRLNMDKFYYESIKPDSFQPYTPQQVLSLVFHANTSKIFVANISIPSLFNDLVNLYSLNPEESMLYIVDEENKIIFTADSGKINTDFPVDLKLQENNAFSFKKEVCFFSPFYDNMLYLVISYPINTMNTATNYFAEYVILLCAGLLIFLIILANIVAKKLYLPIDDLYNNIKNTYMESMESPSSIKDEIAILKEAFQSLCANNSSMNYILSSYETIVRNHNLKLYLEGSLSYHDLVDENNTPYLNINKTYYNQLLLFRLPKKYLLSKPVHEMSLLRNKIKDVINTYINNFSNGFFIVLHNDTFLAFINAGKVSTLQQLKQVLCTTMDEILNQHVFCTESNYIYEIEELIPAYHDCINAMKYAVFFHKIDHIVTTPEFKQNYNFKYDFIVNSEAGLIRYILLYNKEECVNIIKEVSGHIRKTPDVSYAVDIWTQILTILCKNLYLEDILNRHVSAEVRQLDTLAEIEEYLIELCGRAIQYYMAHSQTEGQYCTKAKKFIKDNYMRDFSITDVADHLNISYQYLSKIFKIQCGRSMSDYLNYTRIEKSKEYLRETNESFTIIAQKIGYNNVQSFQRFFKKYENLTPCDYRKLYTKSCN